MNSDAPEHGLPRSSIVKTLRSSVNALDRVSYWIIVVAMLAMTTLVVLQVFFRYALSSSIDSADELARLFFVWSIFLAIPHGIRYGIHVGIDLFVMFLPVRLKSLFFVVTAAASAVLMVLVFGFGLISMINKWDQYMPTLPISAGLFYCAVSISGAHSFLHSLLLMIGGPNVWGDETL